MEMLKQSVLPATQKEIDCLMDCAMMLEIHMNKGNSSQALSIMQDMQNSIDSLKNHIKEQKTREQLQAIVSRLKSIGVDSSIVSKYFDNKKS